MTRLTHKKQASEVPNGASGEPARMPDPADSDIAFVESRNVAYAATPKHIQFAQMALIYGLMGTCIGVANLVRILARIVLMPLWLGVALIVAGLMAVLVYFVARDVRNTNEQGGAIPKDLHYEKEDSTKRIRITMRPVPALRLLRTLPEARHGFEPEIARVPLAVGLDKAARKFAWLGGIFGLLAATVIEVFVLKSPEFMPFSLWFIMGMGCVGAIGLPEFVYPTYLRVIPGRLDVIRAPIVGDTLTIIHRFDLREHPISIVGPVVFIEPARAEGEPPPERVKSPKWPHHLVYPADYKPEAVSLHLTPTRQKLLRAIVWGAITEAPTPIIPDDKLLG